MTLTFLTVLKITKIIVLLFNLLTICQKIARLIIEDNCVRQFVYYVVLTVMKYWLKHVFENCKRISPFTIIIIKFTAPCVHTLFEYSTTSRMFLGKPEIKNVLAAGDIFNSSINTSVTVLLDSLLKSSISKWFTRNY